MSGHKILQNGFQLTRQERTKEQKNKTHKSFIAACSGGCFMGIGKKKLIVFLGMREGDWSYFFQYMDFIRSSAIIGPLAIFQEIFCRL